VVVLGFAWVSVKSFQFIHGDVAKLHDAHLKPVAVVGPQETVFKWSRQACEPRDIPDEPARAIRLANGQVRLYASHYISRTMVGSSLNTVKQDCRVALRSTLSARPQEFADREWIASPYTFDGRTVYALIHDEYHGWQHANGGCLGKDTRACLYNAITLVRSDDSGQTFTHAAPPPANLVAALPYPYKAGEGTYGVFNPSNIVKKDGYYYSLVVVQPYRAQKGGTCLLRTRNLADVRSWRAWDGEGFDIGFANPYDARAVAAGNHLCEPVSPEIGTMTSSLTFNTYFGKYLLVGTGSAYDASKRRTVYGFYYSVSDDLINWNRPKLIREEELPWTYRCGNADPVLYPSVLDPESKSRNFETTGQRVYLYFTRFHYSACQETLNRDLVRIPIQFSE
jgi:hypothetical protein